MAIETLKVLDSDFWWYTVRVVEEESHTVVKEFATLYQTKGMARRAAQRWLRSHDFSWVR